jgi:hypothetical protein
MALLLEEPPAVLERVQSRLASVGMHFKTVWSISEREPHLWRAAWTEKAAARQRAKPEWAVSMMGLQGVYRTNDFLAVAWLEVKELLEKKTALVRCEDCGKHWVNIQRPEPTPKGRPRKVRCESCDGSLEERRPKSKHPEYQRLLMAARNAGKGGRSLDQERHQKKLREWCNEHGVKNRDRWY